MRPALTAGPALTAAGVDGGAGVDRGAGVDGGAGVDWGRAEQTGAEHSGTEQREPAYPQRLVQPVDEYRRFAPIKRLARAGGRQPGIDERAEHRDTEDLAGLPQRVDDGRGHSGPRSVDCGHRVRPRRGGAEHHERGEARERVRVLPG